MKPLRANSTELVGRAEALIRPTCSISSAGRARPLCLAGRGLHDGVGNLPGRGGCRPWKGGQCLPGMHRIGVNI